MSNSYYEDILIPNEGIAVKMGVSNSFEDDFYYEAHIYDIAKANPEVEERDGNRAVLVNSLYKNVTYPYAEKHLDIYGSMAIDIRDIDLLSKQIREVANNIRCNVIHKYIPIDEVGKTKIERNLAQYGGDILYCHSRSFRRVGRPDPNPLFIAETALHVHQWRDYRSGDYDILITSLSKTDDEYESFDYDSVFIRIDYEEKFIAALEQMKERIESSISISKDS